MYSLSTLPIIASLAAFAAFPFSVSVGGALLLAGALGGIIRADYVQRHQRLRLPRLPQAANIAAPHSSSRAEQHPLAA